MSITVTIECRPEAAAASLRLAAASVSETRQLTQAAPDGQVLHLAEAHALGQGRKSLLAPLQAVAPARIDAAE